ncbi:MAG: helicase-related protein, partial [Gemmatimonadales bacterium]
MKALAVDVQQNLETPLREIAEVAAEMGMTLPALRAEVRTGDTTQSMRAAMIKRPPNFLVTTPESLYLLVTAQRSRAALTTVSTIIVDEIHAVARDKRGSHLMVTLERLDRLCAQRPVRIGLSATQRPIETVARLLVGAGPLRSNSDGGPRCAIVDVGHRRALDVAVELPSGELEAVASREQLGEVLDAIAAHVRAHRTTLVFVNTRRMAERVAHLLAERLGDDAVAAHHGSLSKERRQRVESQLRAGELRALVATASLELGIDIGPIEMVCQIASPRSIATFLQRVGRSGHSRGGTPKGRLYPMTRDELVECTAVLAGVRTGALDAVHPPRLPLDILAQQIVAECAAESWREDDLYELMRKAAPFADLTREDFDRVVELVSDGIPTGRGRVAAYLHRDQINGEVRARRGARLAALTSGGAIPETGDYRVLAEPDDTFIGTVNEDWAIESQAGDIFLLGSTSWKIRRVVAGTVRVVDAHGAPPSVPFWLGEAPARTEELSREVSDLRSGVEDLLAEGGADEAITWVEQRAGVDNDVAAMVVRYLAAGRTALGVVPTLEHIVLERFFDDSGGMQLVVHAPFGRVNRALGLALRKRFCATFDFELQAAASDDCVLLSLGPQHSFPLEDIPKFLSSATVEEVLRKAAIFAPMWAVRWRWNLNRSLTVLRFKGGRKNPAPIQRLESDDIMGAVFPQLVACQNENPTGPLEPPDHPLVNQTMYDCLHEVMDVDSLRELVARIERKEVEISFRDTVEPSPLAHEIVNGRPYTFLDDAPLEERRSRAITLRRGLPVEARDLAALDPDAVARVRGEAAPDPRDREELHDLLVALVVMRAVPSWTAWFDELVARGRALTVTHDGDVFWGAMERAMGIQALWPAASMVPRPLPLPRAVPGAAPDRDALITAILRGHLEVNGPMTADALSALTGLRVSEVAIGLAATEGEGFVIRGHFDPGIGDEQWCARRLLARIHSYTQHRLRQEIEPVSAQDFVRFLLRWQRVAPGTQREGRAGVAATIAQLQGFEIPTRVWEETVLPSRVSGYRSAWLDELCMSGEVAWARLKVRDEGDGTAPLRSNTSASRATPVTLVMRSDLPWLLQSVRGDAQPLEPASGATRDVLDALREHGALFTGDIVTMARRLPSEVESALWDGVARGLLTADGFSAVRRLLVSRRLGNSRPHRRGLRHGVSGYASGEGRWSLVPRVLPADDRDALAEAIAEQLLVRWGVV